MARASPDPTRRYPLGDERSVVFLKAVVTNPQIEVGEYSYYHDFDDPTAFETRNVRYLFPFEGDRLVIGRFCAIGHGATFIMNGGNHGTDGVATYPFGIFGEGWAGATPESWPSKGDLVVGHDVWIRYRATLMAGLTVGHGAVVGAMSVVTSDVPPYAVVAGNPARGDPLPAGARGHRAAAGARLVGLADREDTAHVRTIALGDVTAFEAAVA